MSIKQIIGAIFIGLAALFLTDRFLNLTRITPPILKYYDETYGALNVPGIRYMKSREGFFLGTTNYDGRFRENYPKRKKDKNTLRIILVGDSFVEGIDVLSRNHFASIMEQKISAALNCTVEILDFGRGNCTIQPSSYYYLNYIKKEYDANLVLFFTEARDIEPITDFPSTSFVYNESTKQLEASKDWNQSSDYKLTKKLDDIKVLPLLNASGLFRLTYRARSGLQMYGFWPKILGKFYGEVQPQTYDRVETDKAMSKTSEKIFDTLSKQTDPPVWFVIRNFPFESKSLEKYMDSVQYDYISLKDTLDFKQIRNTEDDAYYFKTTGLYGGHWNHLGHKAVGNFLSNRIINGIKNGTIKPYNFNYVR